MNPSPQISNGSRFRPGEPGGFYESYFQRANHPSRPLAFWIRYTVFSPRGRPQEAEGELWAVFFDGESGSITAAKETKPLDACRFDPTRIDVRIGNAVLGDGHLEGSAANPAHRLQWALRYTSPEPPLLLLPGKLYESAFPRAKAMVGSPNALYEGSIEVDGTRFDIHGWKGSQNHNWGSRHTDRYAWGQVAGFDNAPDAFLECSTAQVRIGPFWTPRFSLVVLRDEGREIALNGLLQAVRASGSFDFFTWRIDSQGPGARVSCRIRAPESAFVGLSYRNPPGGVKTCLNTKLASAEVTVRRPGVSPRTLVTQNRAAFEILTDRTDHGVPVVA